VCTSCKDDIEQPSEGDGVKGIANRGTGSKEWNLLLAFIEPQAVLFWGIASFFGIVFFRTKWAPEVPANPHAIDDEDDNQNIVLEISKFQRFTNTQSGTWSTLWGCICKLLQYRLSSGSRAVLHFLLCEVADASC